MKKEKNIGLKILQVIAFLIFILCLLFAMFLHSFGKSMQGISESKEKTWREAGMINSIFEKNRGQNSEAGNAKIKTEYKSVKEFMFNSLEVRYLGKHDGKFMFEVFYNSWGSAGMNFGVYDNEGKLISRSYDDLVQGETPKVLYMQVPFDNKDAEFSYFGEENLHGEVDMVRVDGQPVIVPPKTKDFGTWSSVTDEKGKLYDYRYTKTERVRCKDCNGSTSFLYLYMEIQVPENNRQEEPFDFIFPSKLQVYGPTYQYSEVEIDNGITIKSLPFPEGIVNEETRNVTLASKSGQTFTYIRVFEYYPSSKERKVQLVDLVSRREKDKIRDVFDLNVVENT